MAGQAHVFFTTMVRSGTETFFVDVGGNNRAKYIKVSHSARNGTEKKVQTMKFCVDTAEQILLALTDAIAALKSVVNREPFEMTLAEIMKAAVIVEEPGEMVSVSTSDGERVGGCLMRSGKTKEFYVRYAHYHAVKEAIQRKKIVDDEVVAQYPDLYAKTRKEAFDGNASF